MQKLYLKAATYGKNFISTTDATVHNAFVDACKKLRVLNQLRELSVRAPHCACHATPRPDAVRLCAACRLACR